MGWLEAAILGIVQGLTEFLPVSSTAHVSLVSQVFFGSDAGAAFTAVIQLGTSTALLIYFIKDIWRILKAWVLGLFRRLPQSDPDVRLGWFIIVGSIPVGILGVLFKDAITSSLRNLWVTVAMLVIVGVILWVADVYAAKVAARGSVAAATDVPAVQTAPARARRAMVEDDPAPAPAPVPVAATGATKALAHMTWRDAVIVGVCQAAALIPGVSRSGSTTAAGLFLGYDRPSAARYSFWLSIPAVWASGLFELKDIGSQTVDWGPTALATIIAFVVGFAVIAWLLRFISTHTFRPFAVYRVVLALAVAGLLVSGVLSAGA